MKAGPDGNHGFLLRRAVRIRQSAWGVAPRHSTHRAVSLTILAAIKLTPFPVEAADFVQILEMAENGGGVWRGEWLADFPQYRTLSDADKLTWNAWLHRPETSAYLDQAIERCSHLAEKARNMRGYAVFKDRP